MKFKFYLLMICLGLSMQVWMPTQAHGIQVSVTEREEKRPAVLNTRVPVVNIAPPSAGGVSNNVYTEFNVGVSGVVLNNSRRNCQKTTQAGEITGNPKLQGTRSATIILNQVLKSNGRSQLLGPLEVAGPSAQIIVANPNGIVCNGCRFVNADRVMLTTGRPLFRDGKLTGFNVTSGHLRITGDGLKGPDVDLIARSLKLDNATTIEADALRIMVGPGRVDFPSNEFKVNEETIAPMQVILGEGGQGGIVVKEGIHLLVTNVGIGMNIGSDLVSDNGNVLIDAAGHVRIAPQVTVRSAEALKVSAGDGLTVEGSVSSSKGPVLLTVHGETRITGQVDAVGPVDLRVRRLTVSESDQAKASQIQVSHAQRPQAGGNLRIEGSVSSSKGAVSLAAHGNTRITGRVDAAGPVDLRVGQDLKLSESGHLKADQLEAGQALEPKVIVHLDDGLTVHTGGALNIKGSISSLKGPVSLVAGGNTEITGQVEAAGPADQTIRHALTIAKFGLVKVGQALEARGDRQSLPGGSASGDQLQIAAAGHMHITSKATVRSVGALSVLAEGDQDIEGSVLSSKGAILLAANSNATVTGLVDAAGPVNLRVGQDLKLSESGQVRGQGELTAVANRVSVAGTMQSSHEATVKARGQFDLNGTVKAEQAVRVATDRNLFIHQGGSAQGGRDLLLFAKESILVAGEASAMMGEVGMSARHSLFGKPESRITAEDSLTLSAAQALRLDGEVTSNQGHLFAKGARTIVSKNAHLKANVASLEATEKLTIEGQVDSLAEPPILKENGHLKSAETDWLKAGQDL